MKRSIPTIILLTVGLLLTSCAVNYLQKGHTAYDRLEYHHAIDYYEKALTTSDDDLAKRRLADSYRLTSQFDKAEPWYAAAASGPVVDPEVQYQYARVLLANDKPADARIWAEAFLRQAPTDARRKALLEAIEQREAWLSKNRQVEVTPMAFNTAASEFSPAFFGDRIAFVTDREGTPDPWTGRHYARIYLGDPLTGSAYAWPGHTPGEYSEGPLSLCRNGRTCYYSRNNDRSGKGKDDVIRVSIYHASLIAGEWVPGVPFPYNSTEYSNMHPSLNEAGDTMIYASDQGGLGGMDLFMSVQQGGQWSLPQNLGAPVNSPGNEAFPFLAPDGTLYFASDGLPGLGGLDVFMVKRLGAGWSDPVNVGSPINSSKDDFGLISADQLFSGYFSSNRNATDGTDDLFHFERRREDLLLNGLVVDLETGIPLPMVDVTLLNTATGQEFHTTTQENGRFQFDLPDNAVYRVSGMKNGIETNLEIVDPARFDPEEQLFVKLLHHDPRFTLNGKALTKNDQQPVPGVTVKLYNATKGGEKTAVSDATGSFSFQLEQYSDFQVTGEKDGYFTTVQEVTTKGLDRSTTLYTKLYLTIEEVIVGTNISLKNNCIGDICFEDILYDFDDYHIRSDAARELDKLLQLLKLNPSLQIELGSHTDSRGRSSYNLRLSQQRADAAVNYIVSRGIARSRISARGYGETRLVNRCDDGVDCTEAEHQANRRTEIRILRN